MSDKRVKFSNDNSNKVDVSSKETWSPFEYPRGADKTWENLTEEQKEQINAEIKELKEKDMNLSEDSRNTTSISPF